MGWMYTNKPKGMSLFEFFSERFNFKNENSEAKVVDCAVVNFRTAYIALWINNPAEKGVFAVVCHLNYCNDYHNLGYKAETEEMGPINHECPERILKQLSPTDDKWALEWREKCWKNISNKKSKPKLKPGMIIKFQKPVRFKGGIEKSIFKVLSPQKLLFTDMYGYQRYKIKRDILNKQEWEVISIEEARNLA